MNPIPPDGRQSQSALDICRGTQRLLAAHGYASLPEVSLPNGRRADVMAVGLKDVIAIIEIKSSLEDFRTDHKWQDYLEYCDTFYFAVAPDFPRAILPETQGLIIADRYSAIFAQERSPIPLNAGRRRAMIAGLARAACLRLQSIADPEVLALQRGVGI